MTGNKKNFIIMLSFCFSMQALAQVNLQQGLVAYYPFNGNANDESGNGNNGTVYGATLTTDRFGNQNSAFYFDGENNNIEISDNVSLRPQYISISAWAYPESSQGMLLGKSVYSNAASEQYALGAGHFYFNIKRNSFCQPGFGWNWVGNSGYSLYNWYHAIGTYDGSIMKIFVNGILVATNTNVQGPIDGCEGGNLRIGKWWANDPQNFKGKLDDIRIYNRALSQDEVNALYNEGIYLTEVTITQVLQHSDGSGLVDVNFDLSGTANLYSISLEASFDGGTTYIPIPGSFLSGDIGPIQPGNSKHIVWDGVGSFPNIYSTQAKLKIVASQLGAPCAGMPTITDIDGNIYNTVQIGSQCWMKENLNIGTRIAGATNQTENGVIEKYCYDDDESNCDIYGGLYQWDEMMQNVAIAGTQGICPQGWHLPTDEEWTTLTSYLLGFLVAGGKMKTTGTLEAGTGLWYSPNTGATNNSGFSGLPSGWRRSNGEPLFEHQGNIGHLWSSSTRFDYGVIQQLANSDATSSWAYSWKSGGLPVRCLKDN